MDCLVNDLSKYNSPITMCISSHSWYPISAVGENSYSYNWSISTKPAKHLCLNFTDFVDFLVIRTLGTTAHISASFLVSWRDYGLSMYRRIYSHVLYKKMIHRFGDMSTLLPGLSSHLSIWVLIQHYSMIPIGLYLCRLTKVVFRLVEKHLVV